MKTNDMYDSGRMMAELRLYVACRRSSLLLRAVALLAAMLLIGLLAGWIDSSRAVINLQLGVMCVVAMVGGLLAASSAFGEMAGRDSAIDLLMSPASMLEKFIARWIVTVPAYILWAIVCAMCGDLLRVLFIAVSDGDGLGELAPWWSLLTGQSGPFGYPDGLMYVVLMTYLALQSFFLLGSIVWRRYNFMKTLPVVFILGLFYMIEGMLVYDASDARSIDISGLQLALISLIVTAVNYTLTYFRFKESDVIHRW